MKTTLKTIFACGDRYYVEATPAGAGYSGQTDTHAIPGECDSLDHAVSVARRQNWKGYESITVHTNTIATGVLKLDSPVIATMLVKDGVAESLSE